MSDKDREQTNLTPEEIEEFNDTDLPADATVEDAMGAFMKVDPKKVKKAEEKAALRKIRTAEPAGVNEHPQTMPPELLQVLDAVPDLIWRAEIDDKKILRFEFGSPQLEPLTGRAMDSFGELPAAWFEIIHPEDRPRMVQLGMRLMSDESDREEAEYRIVRQDGAIRWVRDTTVVTRSPDGTRHMQSTVSDITALREAESARRSAEATQRRSEERLDAIRAKLESIASLDFSGRLRLSSRVDSLDAVASGLNMMSEELQANVVERSKLEELVTELEVANQELQAFSDVLAHDLRNPLLIVTNFSHQLREALGDSLGEQEAVDLERIRSASRHMLHLIDDLRDLGNVNRVELSREEVDLSTMGQDIIDDLSALVPDRDVRFEAEPGIKALGDKTLLRILLTNLLQNAWKYTRPSDDARIELSVDEDESDGPTYHVRDNGIGFHNADREVIFQAFKRLQTRWEFTGSGVGLATVERIARRHGGRVWAEGVPGEGAVFRFTLGSSSTDRRGSKRPSLDG